jgi:hypothetical protein
MAFLVYTCPSAFPAAPDFAPLAVFICIQGRFHRVFYSSSHNLSDERTSVRYDNKGIDVTEQGSAGPGNRQFFPSDPGVL